MSSKFWGALLPSVAIVAPANGTVYLSVTQAQATLFPGQPLTAAPRTLTAEQSKAIRQASRVGVISRDLKAWRAADGGWFIVDQVLGKHEFITFALGIDAAGAVKGVEILEYRESYGGEVRNAAWRAQFAGKTVAAPLVLDKDIRNISGATLSSRHVTDGVKRLLATHRLVLATG